MCRLGAGEVFAAPLEETEFTGREVKVSKKSGAVSAHGYPCFLPVDLAFMEDVVVGNEVMDGSDQGFLCKHHGSGLLSLASCLRDPFGFPGTCKLVLGQPNEPGGCTFSLHFWPDGFKERAELLCDVVMVQLIVECGEIEDFNGV